MRRHVERLRASVTTPSDAWLLARMLGWSALLPMAKHAIPLPRLVRLMHAPSPARGRDPHREATIAGLAGWVFKSRPRRSRDNCLERALVTYRYLSRAGAEPELVVGIAAPGEWSRGHAWVRVDGDAVHDEPASLRPYEALLVFRSDGTMMQPEPPSAT